MMRTSKVSRTVQLGYYITVKLGKRVLSIFKSVYVSASAAESWSRGGMVAWDSNCACENFYHLSKFFFFFLFSYYIQHCFICRPSDSTVPTDARTVATGALTVRRSNH